MKSLQSSLFTNLQPLSYTNHGGAPLPSRTIPSRRASVVSVSADARQKVVVIMGPTGCGKTKLSIDLAAECFPSSEIINSDKIQVYRGLDITTNKVPLEERKSVPHHLLGDFDPTDAHPEFTHSDFRSSASDIITSSRGRNVLPFVVGGSNSFVHALLAERFDPEAGSVFSRELRYDCCFLWVDVSSTVLSRYIEKRVDDMLAAGMLDELSEYFEGLGLGRLVEQGLNRAIGVPEFERYFRGGTTYGQAVREVKDNTWELVKRQVEKIRRLREEAGWEMNRVDNTATLRAAVEGAGRKEATEIWEEQVLQPSARIVREFLIN